MAQRALTYRVIIDGRDSGIHECDRACLPYWRKRAQIIGRPVALVDARLPRYAWRALASAIASWPGTLLADPGHGMAHWHAHFEFAALAIAALIVVAACCQLVRR